MSVGENVTGSPVIVPSVTALYADLGEPVTVHHTERLTPLTPGEVVAGVHELKAGDIVVAFSRKTVLNMSANIRASGKSVATIYGALSPETRREQARRFNTGVAQVLVATDAIGMGLNLPAKRVVFAATEKFDGFEMRDLTRTECAQIAGRAGRYGMHAAGEFSAFSRGGLALLKKKLESLPLGEQTPLPIAPSLRHVTALSKVLGTSQLTTLLKYFANELVIDHKLYTPASLTDLIDLASIADSHKKKLSLAIRFTYATAPISASKDTEVTYFEQLLRAHANGTTHAAPSLPKFKSGASQLETAEQLSKQVSLYAWLAYKFPEVYPDQDSIPALRQELTRYITQALLNQNGVPRKVYADEGFW